MIEPLSEAMQDLLLRLLHHDDATVAEGDKTTESLIERGLALWLSWGPAPDIFVRSGLGRVALSKLGRVVAREMETAGVRRPVMTEEGVERLLLKAIEFAGGEDMFKRLGHKVRAQSFRSEGGTIEVRTDGIGIQVDGPGTPVFHVTIKKIR